MTGWREFRPLAHTCFQVAPLSWLLQQRRFLHRVDRDVRKRAEPHGLSRPRGIVARHLPYGVEHILMVPSDSRSGDEHLQTEVGGKPTDRVGQKLINSPGLTSSSFCTFNLGVLVVEQPACWTSSLPCQLAGALIAFISSARARALSRVSRWPCRRSAGAQGQTFVTPNRKDLHL
jgi:hypothetical protein